MKISEKIKKYRLSVGISQSELARRAGLTGAAISKLEKGNTEPTLDTIKRLSTTLNVGVSELMEKVISPNLSAKDKFFMEFGDILRLSKEDRVIIKKLVARLQLHEKYGI